MRGPVQKQRWEDGKNYTDIDYELHGAWETTHALFYTLHFTLYYFTLYSPWTLTSTSDQVQWVNNLWVNDLERNTARHSHSIKH